MTPIATLRGRKPEDLGPLILRVGVVLTCIGYASQLYRQKL